jgi:hypothetical protein
MGEQNSLKIKNKFNILHSTYINYRKPERKRIKDGGEGEVISG